MRKKVDGSLKLNTVPKLNKFLKSALKQWEQNPMSYKYYVVCAEPIPNYPEPLNKHRNILMIRWNDQWIFCSDTKQNMDRWVNENNIEPILAWLNPESKYTDKRHMYGTYRQYSNRTIVEGKWLDREAAGYDPMLEKIHDTLDKFNIDIEWKR